jgi:gluconokinase
MVIVIMGVSGSGKSTVGRLLAQRLDWTYFEGDEFHSAGNIDKMSKGIALDDDDRMPWLASIKEVIDKCVKRGSDAVIACSALRREYRRVLTARVSDIHFVYLEGDPDTIRERINSRDRHYMKATMLESQFSSLEKPDDAMVIDIRHSPQDIVLSIETELTGSGN